LLLARLFARPANVLVLDEPTNDLDIDTLDLLEELLQDYAGTVLLVSHDRTFVNNVVTSTLVKEPGSSGLWREYEGDVNDWLQQSQRASRSSPEAPKPQGEPANAPAAPSNPSTAAAKPRAKLSYKEQRELETLPTRIDALEQEQASIRQTLSDPSIYSQDAQKATQLHERDAEIEELLMQALEQWEALSQRA
jgi:ATP-binding cassette subfamily F protein uup